MEYVIAGICIVAVVVVLFIYKKKKMDNTASEPEQVGGVLSTENRGLVSQSDKRLDGLLIQMETLPAERIDEGKLVEITDSKLLARIGSTIPELAQAGIAGDNAARAVKSGSEILYRAVIPAGTKLADSKGRRGAVRGVFHGDGGRIQGHANFLPVKAKTGAEAAKNIASSMISVGSMVVGQYYMAQINAELGEINDGISKISDFQDSEFRSGVFALVAHVKGIADFQVDILENDELRSSKVAQLNSLEVECTKLLGQANLMLSGFAGKNNIDYAAYEKEIKEAQNWYVYQKALTETLYKISDLQYTLHRGTVSREQCAVLLPVYTKQVEEAQKRLAGWHESTTRRLNIDIAEIKRKREGIDGVIHFIPGLFKEELNFTKIDENTANMIAVQEVGWTIEHPHGATDLYAEDVQLISKDGKIFYLPQGEMRRDREANGIYIV